MKYKIIDEKYKQLILNIEKYFKFSNNSIHKARNEIKIVNYENELFAIKSFKIPNFINKLVYSYFKDSKAKKSYENSLKIQKFVPEPISYIENYKFGFLFTSYFISKKFDYDFTIREPLLENDFTDRKIIFKAFARFTYNLHEMSIYHLDYSPGNILIKKINEEYIFKIVDINRMQFKKLTYVERIKNFNKLWAHEKDLECIISEYSKLIKKESKETFLLAKYFSDQHRNKIKNKKIIKNLFKVKKNG